MRHGGRAPGREEQGVDFVAVVDQVIALLRQRGRVTYRTLKRQFQLDDDVLEGDLTVELTKGERLTADEDGEVLAYWIGEAAAPAAPAAIAPHPLHPWPTRNHLKPRRFSRPAVPWKANGSRSQSCFLT